RLQEAGEIGPTYGDADPVAPAGECPHHMPSDKTGTAEHGHERRKIGQGHDGLPSSLDRIASGVAVSLTESLEEGKVANRRRVDQAPSTTTISASATSWRIFAAIWYSGEL